MMYVYGLDHGELGEHFLVLRGPLACACLDTSTIAKPFILKIKQDIINVFIFSIV